LKSASSSNLLIGAVVVVIFIGTLFNGEDSPKPEPRYTTSSSTQSPTPSPTLEPTPSPSPEAPLPVSSPALSALASVPIKGRAPKTGYERDLFATDWDYSFGCDMRNKILRRDFSEFNLRSGSSCIVETGVLQDPYTGEAISFQRGVGTSNAVQIDHVVSLSDAWQKGAQQLTSDQRYALYNDPLNLLAVSGPANSQKSDSDAASWLPANKGYRCAFVARQVAVKLSYNLWMTQAEFDTIANILSSCPDQSLPTR
jgi:hypothetical protein